MDKSSALDLVNLVNDRTSHKKHNLWCSYRLLGEFRVYVGNRRFAIDVENRQLKRFFDQKDEF
jgi:hypothetical protein